MRTILLSALFAISTALAVPSASLASQAPEPSAWARMKLALPDGVGMDEIPVVPMMDMQFPSFLKKPLERHDTNQKGYKHMEDTLMDPIVITPLSSEEHIPETDSEMVSVSSRRYKKFLGLKDTGEVKFMNIPTPEASISVNGEVVEKIEEAQVDEVNPSLRAKTLVGVDNFGRRRYLDIPYYNRAAQAN